MSEFINTVDIIGDDALTDGLISRTIMELKDDRLVNIRDYVFSHCTMLETVDLPNVIKTEGYTFWNCTSLRNVNLPKLVTTGQRSFQDCTSLETIKLPSLETIGHYYNFLNCSNLKIADFPKLKDGLRWTSTFANCTSLTALILRREDTSTMRLDVSSLRNTGISAGTGYIYVPASLVDSYKSATNWSAYADQIRALEDYTIDGTTTGELDETKI